ncbi:putative disease resistance protein RGA4 [Salvia divinorum]|uniref:Disease resistance protein RGA4 n=1 Tax=Salvia divinorum TaxID=28513 RepID=A0ABD1G6A1_SALDI
MADAMISVVVERIAALIEEKIRYEVSLVRGVEKELPELSDKLKTIRNVLDDAEKRGVNDKSIKGWLKKIEATAFEMDDILDEWEYSLLKHTMEASAEPKKEKVHGMDIYRKKSDIVSKVMLNDAQILSIVGAGGLGKTTLAKLVYNDNQVGDRFQLRIWICVSDPFDAAGIARGIVDIVGKETIPPNTNQLALALQTVEAPISGKKFLLVLDDVWTEDESQWKDLKISLQCGAAGSKILVTTRNERVAKMMGTSDDDMYRPNHLSEEECWSLLRDTSLPGKSEEECGKFECFGKKIASKCKGLPLAAIVLGRFLKFKNLDGWKNVVNSEIWQMEKVEVELFPHLVLSYNELSPTLKRCFSYCSFYPKDSRIHAETLIEQWMAQGYLCSVSGNDEVEVKGRECLNNLAMRSLIHDVEVNESGDQIEWCKMHDILHDFALFLRKNDDKERSCQICDSSTVSHVQEYRSLYLNHRDVRKRGCQVCDCLKSLRVLNVEVIIVTVINVDGGSRALVPHHKLNRLEIMGYGGSRLPHCMSSPLIFIKEIRLYDLSEVSSLPAMGKLPLLESIRIRNVDQLKLVGHEFLGIESSSDDDVVAFPKLKELTIKECQKWEEWEDITEEEEESAAISIMPYLTELTIFECKSLKKLPHRLLRKASSSLRFLTILRSTELIKTYEDDNEGSPWRSISQHNPQL